MIQKGSVLKIIDNSGAKLGCCIKIPTGYKQRYAVLGDIILVSIKKLRSKRRETLKIKKGELHPALIIKTNKINVTSNGDTNIFAENAVILLKKQAKFLGTRVFGGVPKNFRYTKFLKIISLASGVLF